MLSVQGRGAGRHTQPQHQMAKMWKTTGVHKALSRKAIVRERGKTSENCWLEEIWGGGGGVYSRVGDGITVHHGHGANLRKEELQTAPNVEVADRDPGSLGYAACKSCLPRVHLLNTWQVRERSSDH